MTYTTNALILCPGTKPDRRTESRGDRRHDARPCRHSFGRVVNGTVSVRLQPRSGPESLVVVSCPECQSRVEFLTVAAEAA